LDLWEVARKLQETLPCRLHARILQRVKTQGRNKEQAMSDAKIDVRSQQDNAGAAQSAPSIGVQRKAAQPTLQLKHSLRGKSYSDGAAALRFRGGGAPGGGDAAVQAKGGAAGPDIHQAAARGTAGSGAALPHGDAIQMAFGRHDVSGVQAHVGGAAREASAAMGAQAYATGSQVAFREQPDLHTAAHEAAHVVQQRAGVSLPGGVGQAGDVHERHADHVADAVVSGSSAEGLLDRATGGGSGAAVQKSAEPRGEWDTVRMLAKDSYFDLIQQNLLAAEAWKTRAEVEDPPPFWQQALLAVGGLVLNAALGGVGGALAGRLTKGVASFVTQAAIRTAINVGQDACKAGVGRAIKSASGSGSKAPLIAFCEQQRLGMGPASKAAREAFVAATGNADDQKMTIADMQATKDANDAAFTDAVAIQDREMLIGWMGMQAGDTSKTPGTTGASTEGNVEDIDNNGILRIRISGLNDAPLSISSAEVDGLNESLRADLAGSTLGTWLPGGKRQSGIDVLVTTGSPASRPRSFQLAAGTWARAQAAGVAPGRHTVSGMNHSVFFSFLAERTGKLAWCDSDMDWSVDYNWGADAGRWFLNNVKSYHQIMSELRGKTLPSTVRG
jgi:hypothetical protein